MMVYQIRSGAGAWCGIALVSYVASSPSLSIGCFPSRISQEDLNLGPGWERVLRPMLGACQPCCSVRKAHGSCERTPLSQRHCERPVERITGGRRLYESGAESHGMS